MELNHKDIPVQFLSTLPEGIKLVNRKGHSFLVVEEVYDDTGNSLVSDTVRIHGEPSIKLKVAIGNADGIIYLDAFWGSHAKLYSFVPDLSSSGGRVEAFSPKTGNSLMTDWNCDQEECDSDRAILLHLPGSQNKIYVCSRLGCPGHHLDIRELPESVTDTVSNINFFGEGEDEFFQGI
jgi:hypothetical protein